MKKLIVLSALILFAGITFGQTLQKGNLVGTHVLTIELNPGVTMEQYMDFQLNTVLPEFEKYYPGWKFYLIKSIRGENKNSYGQIIVVESEEVRNKYYNADGSSSEFGQAAAEKMKAVREESEKLGQLKRTYTDWIVQ